MKLRFVSILFIVAVSGYGAPLGFSAGVMTGLSLDNQSVKIRDSGAGYKRDTNGYIASVLAGGFLDLRYVEVSALYAHQFAVAMVTENELTPTDNTTEVTFSTTAYQNLNMSVLAKYPFEFSWITLFPLLGLEYSLNLNAADKDALSESQKQELNDIFLAWGFGMDFHVDERIYLRTKLHYGINLTPTSTELRDYLTDFGFTYTDFGYRVNLMLGLGLRF